jgi:hypothetical protein
MKRLILKLTLLAGLLSVSGCCCFRPPWGMMMNMMPTDQEMFQMMQSRGGQQNWVAPTPAQEPATPAASDSSNASP